jgi:hypothetical protein
LARGEIKDFAAVARRLLTAPVPSLHTEALGIVLLEWGREDPAAALKFIRDERSGVREIEARIGSEWAARDPAAALAFVKSSRFGVSSEQVGQFVRAALSQGDPAARMKILRAHLSEPAIRSVSAEVRDRG